MGPKVGELGRPKAPANTPHAEKIYGHPLRALKDFMGVSGDDRGGGVQGRGIALPVPFSQISPLTFTEGGAVGVITYPPRCLRGRV